MLFRAVSPSWTHSSANVQWESNSDFVDCERCWNHSEIMMCRNHSERGDNLRFPNSKLDMLDACLKVKKLLTIYDNYEGFCQIPMKVSLKHPSLQLQKCLRLKNYRNSAKSQILALYPLNWKSWQNLWQLLRENTSRKIKLNKMKCNDFKAGK